MPRFENAQISSGQLRMARPIGCGTLCNEASELVYRRRRKGNKKSKVCRRRARSVEIQDSGGPSLVNERAHKHNPKLEHGASDGCRRSRTLLKEQMHLGLEDWRRREDIRGPMEARMERWIVCNSRGMFLLSTRLRNVDVDE